MHPRTGSTPEQLAELEHETGLVFGGFVLADRDQLVPVLLRPGRSPLEVRTVIQRLNSAEGRRPRAQL
jgi:hypothetical protein